MSYYSPELETKPAFSAIGLLCAAWSAVKGGFFLPCHQPSFVWAPTDSSNLWQVTICSLAMAITWQELQARKSVMERNAFKIFPHYVYIQDFECNMT